MGKKRDSLNLSRREWQVLEAIWKEKSNSEIAAEYKLSVSTVETHRKHIMAATESKNVVALTKFCFKHGLFNSYKLIKRKHGN